MGRDKAWVVCEGQPLIALALNTIRTAGIKVFVSGGTNGDYSALECPVLLDLKPELGSLSGIERGLYHCTSPLLLVLPVDLPRITATYLATLQTRCGKCSGVVSQLRNRLEPLVAIYPRRCHQFALRRVLDGSRAVHEFATDCLKEKAVTRWRVTAADAPCFSNWNYPDDVGRLG